ncbi:MAG: Ig-like domain-containing protein [bacterium]|nr:Ig-like domain-containing protein [bacterium]
MFEIMSPKKIIRAVLIIGALSLILFPVTAIRATDPPRIVSTIPRAGAGDVDSSVEIKAVFSRDMNPDAFHVFSVWLEDSETHEKKYIKIKYISREKALVVIPVEPLPGGRKFETILSDEISDMDGVSIGSIYRWGFGVAGEKPAVTAVKPVQAKKSSRPFKLLSVLPLDGTEDVPPETRVTVYFTRRLDPESVKSSCVKLLRDGIPVAATVSYQALIKRIILVPEEPLDTGKKYSVEISGEITDDLGRKLGSTKAFGFVTSPAVGAVKPVEAGKDLNEGPDRPRLVPPVPGGPPVSVSDPEEEPDILKIREQISRRLAERATEQKKSREREQEERKERLALQKAKIALTLSERMEELEEPEEPAKIEEIEKPEDLKPLETAELKDLVSRLREKSEFEALELGGAEVSASKPEPEEPKIAVAEVRESGEVEELPDIDTGEGIEFLEEIDDDLSEELEIIGDAEIPTEVEVTETEEIPAFLEEELEELEDVPVVDDIEKPKGVPIQPFPVAFSPSDGSMAVPVSSSVEILFDTPLDPISVTPLNVRLTVEEISVAGDIVLDASGKKMTFIPSSPLVGGRWHYFEVDESVRSKSGAFLGKNVGARFLTEEPEDSIAPYVLRVLPPIGAEKVTFDTRISVVFSENIDRKTLTSMTLLVSREGEAVYGEITYDEEKNTAIFIPARSLQAGIEYHVGVSKAVTDKAGNELQSGLEWSFTTMPPLDAIAPFVTSLSPVDGARGVSSDSTIEVLFSEPVDKLTLNPFVLTINDGINNIRGEITYEPAERKVTFVPAAALSFSTTYRATIKAVMDKAGNIMDKPVVWVFTTKTPPDTKSPQVIALRPAPGSKEENVFPTIYAEFDEDLVRKSINPFTVYLETDSGLRIAGEVYFDQAARRIFFTPAMELEYGARYQMVLTSDITDTPGNRLEDEIHWSFTTKEPVDSERPTILSVSPLVGAENVLVTAHVLVRFSEAVNEVSISPVTLRILKRGKEVPGVLYYNSDSWEALYVPNAPFEYGSVYKVVVEQNIEDLAGNPLALRAAWTFSTEPPPDTIPPSVIKVSPIVGAREVSLETEVVVEFSEPVDVGTITAFNFGLRYESRDVSGEIAYDESSRTVHFKPLKPLMKDTLYEVVVDRGITDLAGNLLENRFTWRFKTGRKYQARPAGVLEALPDEVAGYVAKSRLQELPRITTTVPIENNVNVPVESTVMLHFNKPMDNETMNESSVFILDQDGEQVPVVYVYHETAMKLELRPQPSFSYNTAYSVVAMAHRVKDFLGNALVEDLTLSFETATPEGVPKLSVEEKARVAMQEKWKDTMPGGLKSEVIADIGTHAAKAVKKDLMVISVSPRNGAVNVVETPSITATFNHEVDPLTINRYTVSIDDGDRFVEGGVTYNQATRKIMFIPKETLKQGVTYRGTITADVRNLMGKPMGTSKVWTFTILERTGPEIIETVPGIEAEDVPITSNIKVVFNKQIVGVTLTPFSFKVKNEKGEIDGDIRYNSMKREAIFVPAETLEFGTVYEVFLLPGIQDLQGNQLSRQYTWAFMTSGDPY